MNPQISKIFNDYPNPPPEGGNFDDALWSCLCDCIDVSNYRELPKPVQVYILIRNTEWTSAVDGMDALLFNEDNLEQYLLDLTEAYTILGVTVGASAANEAHKFLKQTSDWKSILKSDSLNEELARQDQFIESFCEIFDRAGFDGSFDSYPVLIPYVIKHQVDFESVPL